MRIVTSARLRALTTETAEARTRLHRAQEQADAAYVRHVDEVRRLAADTEQAEADAATARAEVARLAAELSEVRAKATVPVALLLRDGVPDSVHASVQAAKDYAATQGAHPAGWARQSNPSDVSRWLIMPVQRNGGEA